MKTTLIAGDVWPQLSAAAKSTTRPSYVAVAYFSEHASKLLTLRPNSWLVVNASRAAIQSGQTHPATLLKLVQRGVRVYSVSDLHAKVFVFGKRAFVGSANVSRSSSQSMIEAMVVTTERGAVTEARDFVSGLCKEELSPEFLRSLQKHYKRPHFTQAPTRRRRRMSVRTPPLRIAKLVLGDRPKEEAAIERAGRKAARAAREHGRGWELQGFRWGGVCPFKEGDYVMQAIDQGDGKRLVEPPGRVLKVAHARPRRGRAAYVFLEVPKVGRRPSIATLAKRLGYGAKKALMRGGVPGRAFADRLRHYWNR